MTKTFRLVFFLLACAIVGWLLWINTASADDDRHGSGDRVDVDVNTGDNTVNAGDLVGGSNSNKSWGFSHSLGDVDINEGANCFGSEAFGSVIVSRQWNELNPWCAGLFYDLNGKHRMAAIMRCDIKSVRAHFENDEDCIAENILAGPEATEAQPPPELAALYQQAAQFDEHEDREEKHEYELAATRQRQDELEAAIRRETANRRNDRANIEKAQKQKVDEDYEFAQQMLEQYVQIVEPPTGSE